MMSAKMATLGPLKLKVLWNKNYDVIIYVHEVANRILWRDSSYIVDVVMLQKFDNSSISMREVTITSFLKGFDQKNHFFRGGLGSSSIIWDLHYIWPWNFITSVAKGLKLKVRKFWELIPMFVEVIGKNW